MALHIHRFDSPQKTAQELALAVSEDLQKALAGSLEPIAARALLLVSGGRSPLPFFSALAAQALPWDQIDVSLVDERSVPADHPDANARLVREHLLRGAASAASFVPLMAEIDETDPWRWAVQSAAAANAKLELAQPAAIVLGLGTDGHTASLFPDAPQWQEGSTTPTRYLAVTPTQAPHPRVSLSLSALIAQRTCYVWSNGPEKLEVINRLQTLAAAVASGTAEAGALHRAGPFAMLIAHPEVNLRVFHCEQ